MKRNSVARRRETPPRSTTSACITIQATAWRGITRKPSGTITLAVNEWSTIDLADKPFLRFTAAANTRYLQSNPWQTFILYDSKYEEQAGPQGDLQYDDLRDDLTIGETYYVWVGDRLSSSGTCRVTLSPIPVSPDDVTTMNNNTWVNADLTGKSEQWFKWSGGGNILHASFFGTLNADKGIDIRIYNAKTLTATRA